MGKGLVIFLNRLLILHEIRCLNHISAPLQLDDGTWWTIGQSYELYGTDDWSGKGRQSSLYQVVWEGDRPWGVAPSTQPVVKPNLPKSGIAWRSVQSDEFSNDLLSHDWHFINRNISKQLFTFLQERAGYELLLIHNA